MDGKKPQRLIITYPFPIGAANGGARMTREIARHIALTGCEVILLPVNIATHAPGFLRRQAASEVSGFEFERELNAVGVTIQRIAPNRYSRWLDSRAVKKAVNSIIARQPVDAVLSFYREGGNLPGLLRRQRIPFGFICTWQSYAAALDSTGTGWRKPFLNLFNQQMVVKPMQESAVCFATSTFTRDELVDVVKVRPEKVKLCHLGVDEHFFSIPREKRNVVRRILFFGRFVKPKGIADALHACSRLAANGVEDWEFHLFGDGDPAWISKLVTELGILDRVFINQPLDDQGLQRELGKADVAILPSHFEAFGLVFAEAQAAGLPVVAYRAGSVPEIVQDGVSGWLAPLHDREQLALDLATALNDPAEAYRRGMAGRSWVQDRFTWQRTAHTILDGLTALMNEEQAS